MPVRRTSERLDEETSEWRVYCSAWHGQYACLTDLEYVIKQHSLVSHPQAGSPRTVARWLPSIPALHPIPAAPGEEREFLSSAVEHGRATPPAWVPEWPSGTGIAHLPWRVTESVDFSVTWARLCYSYSVLFLTPAPYLLTVHFKTASFTLADSIVSPAFTIPWLYFGCLIGQCQNSTNVSYGYIFVVVSLESKVNNRPYKY